MRSINTISEWRCHVLLLALVASAILLPLLSAGAEDLKTELVERITKEQVATLFPSAAKENVHTNWPLVQTELRQFGLGDSKEVVVYALATIRVETSNFSPDPERPSTYSKTIDQPSYAGIQAPGTERPFGKYDSTLTFRKDGTPIINLHLGNCYYTGIDEELMRSRHGMLPRTECEDGILFRGRGFVQLTGRYNYEQMQKQIKDKVSVDIVENPDEVSKPEVAAKIMAAYLSNNRGEIEQLLNGNNLASARRIVNKAALGLDVFSTAIHKAKIIVSTAEKGDSMPPSTPTGLSIQ